MGSSYVSITSMKCFAELAGELSRDGGISDETEKGKSFFFFFFVDSIENSRILCGI